MTTRQRDWEAIVDLIERVLADDDLLPAVVAAVRSHVEESATLPVSDITGHTRVLLTAAGRAVAGRRAPTEAELTVVEQLAVNRSRQGIPIDVVLGSVRISERAIWARTRELAEAAEIAADSLLDARELYDDWADAVRTRLIRAHREAPRTRDAWDRDAEAVRRLLEGGSVAALTAAERGFATGAGLWVLVTRSGDTASAAAVRRVSGRRRPRHPAPRGGPRGAAGARPPPPRRPAAPPRAAAPAPAPAPPPGRARPPPAPPRGGPPPRPAPGGGPPRRALRARCPRGPGRGPRRPHAWPAA
jgi:hypothetical protein